MWWRPEDRNLSWAEFCRKKYVAKVEALDPLTTARDGTKQTAISTDAVLFPYEV
jgi:hypothetical protein